MMTINEYFATLTFEQYEDETLHLLDLIAEEADLTEWATARNIDLSAGHIVRGCFFTYFEEWCWSEIED
jgi:hypothetical protein